MPKLVPAAMAVAAGRLDRNWHIFKALREFPSTLLLRTPEGRARYGGCVNGLHQVRAAAFSNLCFDAIARGDVCCHPAPTPAGARTPGRGIAGIVRAHSFPCDRLL